MEFPKRCYGKNSLESDRKSDRRTKSETNWMNKRTINAVKGKKASRLWSKDRKEED